MIRINLLPREVRKRRRAAVPTLALPKLSLREGLAVPLLAAIFIIEVLGVGGWWVYKRFERNQLAAQIVAKKRESEQLKVQLKDQEIVEAARRDIANRLEVINRVAKTQGIPVLLLSGVLKSIPSGIWLTAFEVKPEEVKVKIERPTATVGGVIEKLEEHRKQVETPGQKGKPGEDFIEVSEVRGFKIVLKGSAFNIVQVADFMDNLKRLGVFSDVDFLATQQGLVEQVKVMNFELTASVKL